MESTQDSADAVLPSPAQIPPDALGNVCRFTAFITHADKPVFTYILRRVGERTLAQDLTQEAFAKAWNAWSTYDPSISEFAWIIRIADRLITDHFRSLNTKKRRHRSEPLLDSMCSHENDPLEQLAEDEEDAMHREQLNAAIEQLSEPDRRLISSWFADLPYAEIAREFGLSESAVGTRLTRVRTELTNICA